MATTTMQTQPVERGTSERLFANRNFRLLWIGEAISLLGDQFSLIALPWLVLQLTGDPFLMGTALALGGIPRAIFMFIGGAVTDRFTPRNVMLVSNILRMFLVLGLAVAILTEQVQVWMIFAFALAFGVADGFFYPAQSAVVPRLVKPHQLGGANALTQGMAQLSMFLGPVLAGVLITLFASGGTVIDGEVVPDTRGIAIAFFFDAITFLASAITLWLIRLERSAAAETGSTDAPAEQSIIQSLIDGLRYVWTDDTLRGFFILIALSTLLINGPMAVGIPVLADRRLAEGAAAFGFIISAYGGGSLIGTILAGVLPRPRRATMGIVLGVIWSALGLAVAGFGLVNTTPLAVGVALAMGIANGYVTILFLTWLQQRTPSAFLGRVMSMLMFASVGLSPVSNALTGALVSINTTAVFVGAGLLMTLTVLWLLRNPAMRAMEIPQPEAAAQA